MGVSEDIEPPPKRVKVPLQESDSFPKQSSAKGPEACSLGDSMARPLTSQGDVETVGSKGVIKRSEFVKIITRALYSLGYEKSGALLEEESGIPLHSPAVNLFIQQVMDGKWDESMSLLRTIGLLDEKTAKLASFLILEQKFLELLRIDNVVGALGTLRNEIVPLHINFNRIHELASCLISPSQCLVLSQDAESSKSRSKILEKLQKLLPPGVMIPEKRLEHLVEKALDMQRDGCAFHNTLDSDISLYSDHQCGRNQIPSESMQKIRELPGQAATATVNEARELVEGGDGEQVGRDEEDDDDGHENDDGEQLEEQPDGEQEGDEEDDDDGDENDDAEQPQEQPAGDSGAGPSSSVRPSAATYHTDPALLRMMRRIDRRMDEFSRSFHRRMDTNEQLLRQIWDAVDRRYPATVQGQS